MARPFIKLVFQMAHDHIDFSDAVLVEGGDDRVDHPDAVYLDQRLGCLKGQWLHPFPNSCRHDNGPFYHMCLFCHTPISSCPISSFAYL